MKKLQFVLFLLFLASCAKSGPSVRFDNLADGQQIKSPFLAKFSVMGFKVAPAGTMEKDTGHHHIIIDGTWIKEGDVIPADEKHLHLGKGQSEAELVLSPGRHTLTLQFADGLHRSYGQRLSQTIQVEVSP